MTDTQQDSLRTPLKDASACSATPEPANDRPLHIAIIGSGSAAFACAIQATGAGASVTIIEAAEVIGGCCVNVGCVPSKILIRAAQLARQQRSNPFDGLANHAPRIARDLLIRQLQARVEELRGTKYQHMLDTNSSLHLIRGHATFMDASHLCISGKNGETRHLQADRILIATGSTPFIPDIAGLAESPYWTSSDAIFATEPPEHLVIIGSSVVALELAQAYGRLGSQVTILARHALLSQEDPLLGERLADVFAAEGIRVLDHARVDRVSHARTPAGGQFRLTTSHGDIKGDRLLIATGRSPNTAHLNLDAIGVRTGADGAIRVDEQLRTNLSHIYAAGDCASMPQFVYVAAAAGTRAAINMTGGNARLDLSCTPAVIFTSPQVATVGLSEQDARGLGFSTDSRVLDLEHVPRALANFETGGFIKLVIDASTERLIGAQVLTEDGGEIIQSAALAIRNRMTVTDLADQLFPYLTMVEGLKLCAQTFNRDITRLSCCAG